MAEHGESHESSDKRKKHGSWMERMKATIGVVGLGTLGASYLLAAAACVTFPPYILAGATVASAYGLLSDGKKAKKGHTAHH